MNHPEKWLDIAGFVSKETGVRADIHTQYFSATIKDENIETQPAFDTEARILCGAGDAWNAGAVFGLLQELTHADRLVLANAIAALYVSYGTTDHPTLSQVRSFLESSPPLSINGTKLLKLH
jgi:sugar/nucleoside kinase (ribokinase family)